MPNISTVGMPEKSIKARVSIERAIWAPNAFEVTPEVNTVTVTVHIN